MTKLNEDDFYEMTKNFLVETAQGEQEYVKRACTPASSTTSWELVRESMGLDESILSPWHALNEGLLSVTGFEAVMDKLHPGWRSAK